MMTAAERDLQRFEDILKEISLIRESLQGLSKEGFLSSEDKKAAIAHHLTVIGEAANCVRPEIQEKYPLVEWRGVIGMRNVLVHHYGKVDYDEVWVVTQDDLNELERNIKDAVAAYPWPVK